MTLFQRFIHNILDWHSPTRITFDGCSLVSSCKVCGARILADSCGNWFSISKGEKP